MTAPATTPFSIPSVQSTANAELAAKLQHLLDTKTKPIGSLGRLEEVAHQLGMIFGSTAPTLQQPQMLLFAGDHGLAKKGVSAFPQPVSWQMAANILQGGAAISVLTRQHHIDLTLIDCGIAKELSAHPQFINAKVCPNGTADASEGPAMRKPECLQAIQVGIDSVKRAPGNAILLGELGISNTSSASLLLAKFENLPIEDCTGAGTGMQGKALEHKIGVLRDTLKLHAEVNETLECLAALGGVEIAAMAGAVLQAAHERRVVVVDGFVTSAAVLAAAKLQPLVLDYCLFSHRSHERGHLLMLNALNANPLLQMDLRLGEGSGAALAWPLLESSTLILNQMASFESAQVSNKSAS